MDLRGIARRHVPFEARLKLRLLLRALNDRRARVRFARSRDHLSRDFPHLVSSYERSIIDYPGQTSFGAAKRHNLTLLASQISGAVIRPGETFSIWELAGRPTERAGYMRAAGLHNRKLTGDIGGSTCLISTVLYNVALLAAMQVTERHCHSVDIYGDARYFELGRDASIEYGYLDLRFTNPHAYPVLLEVDVTPHTVTGRLYATQARRFSVEVLVDPPTVKPAETRYVVDRNLAPDLTSVLQEPVSGLSVTARRITRFDDGSFLEESLPGSVHQPIPGVIAVGSPSLVNRAAT